MTPGDMGQGVAMQIKAKGFTVCTALDKHSRGASGRKHRHRTVRILCAIVEVMDDPVLLRESRKTRHIDCEHDAPPSVFSDWPYTMIGTATRGGTIPGQSPCAAK